MKSLLLWLLLPLSSCEQSLEDNWFIKKDIDKTIITNAKYQDKDISSNWLQAYETKKREIYVNYIKDDIEQITYTVIRNKIQMDIYLLFDWKDRYTKTELNGVKYEDRSEYLEYFQSLLPCKIVHL
jgi:uncharacterized protein YdeI (YjbR/CyaY-like superfamily)